MLQAVGVTVRAIAVAVAVAVAVDFAVDVAVGVKTTLAAVAVLVSILMQDLDPQLQNGFTRTPTHDISQSIETTDSYTRSVFHFYSKGIKCEGWKYTPTNLDPNFRETIAVMGHGFGCQRDIGLDIHADGLAKAGITSLTFDYRNFGGSDGEPRNLIAPTRQVEDWISAVEYARTSGYKNTVAIGTSYAGGHVLVAASKQMNASCVISQVPFIGGPEAMRKNVGSRGVLGVLRILHVYLKDSLHSVLGWNAVGMKITADKSLGEFGYMELGPSQLENYYWNHPKVRLGGWENMSPGRGLLDVLAYKPIEHISKYETPTLIVAMKDDSICSLEDIELAAKKCGDACTLLVRDGDHFTVFDPMHFEALMEQYVEFIYKHCV